MDALQFLKSPAKTRRQSIYALVGDEEFLKRRCRDTIIAQTLGEADPAFAVTTYTGDKLDFSTVRNDLETLPFLSPCRVVVVENADTFVTHNRAALEKFAVQPATHGVLILEVKAFPETTKLAKALPDPAKLTCKAPYTDKLPAWCVSWATATHNVSLDADAAQHLVQLVGTSLGTLDQEIAKLAVAVGNRRTITAEDVHHYVGRSRSADVFKIMDAIGDGKPAIALSILEELFEEGEDPLAILGPLTSQLRKLAAVGRSIGQGRPLTQALDDAGVPSWPKARESAEKQVRWLGRRRLEKLSQWLVEINFGLKGGNALPERLQIERLIVKLARPRSNDVPA